MLSLEAAPGSRLEAENLASFAEELLAAESRRLGRTPQRVLLVPPDQTRLHSMAGPLTREIVRLLGPDAVRILPATGTHRAMGETEIAAMFGDLDPALFLAHDHRRGNRRLGVLPAGFVEALSGGRLSFEFPGDYDEVLLDPLWDLVLSIGQVVPHEVVGMANYTKNLVVGLGGIEAIDYSHWLGAVAGLESIMGRADTPVRRLLDESARRFLSGTNVVYALSVVSRGEDGLGLRGLYAGAGQDAGGAGEEAFLAAAARAEKENIRDLDEPIRTCVVRLDPAEYRSTWLGNKAIYRTRMALADGAELVILAPGIERFGEDPGIDALIRRHGYRGTEAVLEGVRRDPELAACLAAAAHLVHGSSEGRFRITYCTERLSRAEVEGAGFGWLPLRGAEARFGLGAAPAEGWNEGPEGRFFYVSNPALGLWRRAAR
ncbi:MAG: D-mannonate epimerase [Spirochaetaceae bacterium]|nr:D-mannonate epimerase [Spirochaetaceae bacterium]